MFRSILLSITVAALLAASADAQNRKDEKKPTVDLRGSLNDLKLRKAKPDDGLILTEDAWVSLAKTWGIQSPPKVDFTKEFLIVATVLESEVLIHAFGPDKNGKVKVLTIERLPCPDAFSYAIKSLSREGVKTVNGRPLIEEFPPSERK